ncbi:hypothetical protein [Aliidongia dinghuensis]|uniref:hypothetical protein n=1 Tax=Aliidongia dinghuensis TaxID=1867774 RepID=UPI001667F96E|nr:hypothetical protein [Aliidongia dinghuensis]
MGKLAIGSAAFGAGAAAVLLVGAGLPSVEAKLGVMGVELSLSVGDAPAASDPAYLEASMLHRSLDNRLSGVALRVARSGGLRAPVAAPGEAAPVSRVVTAPAEPAEKNHRDI